MFDQRVVEGQCVLGIQDDVVATEALSHSTGWDGIAETVQEQKARSKVVREREGGLLVRL